MKEARLYVDFNEMLEENLVPISLDDSMLDSEGNRIELKLGMTVKLYSDDFSDCSTRDNLIAEGVVELNMNRGWNDEKWLCRLNKKGICNESQEG